MALSESTYLKQIEIATDPNGVAFHVFAERVSIVERDGVVIAQSIHRDSYEAATPEARAILGEAMAASLAGMQQAQTERDLVVAHAAALEARLGEAASTIVTLQGEIQRLTQPASATPEPQG